ncbi:MAG: tail fiber domain-containing protein [Bacteroidales bacterium]|nr:tail fiber domain-containing protein [Bacteroidales bacterium]
MKKNLLFLVTLIAVSIFNITVYSQAPQKFSFQAVARNSTGELIGDASIEVRLGLIAASDQTVVWQETHTVTTSDLGLFYLEVGNGTRVGGTASLFSLINWAADTYSLKVEIDAGLGSGYEDMGSSDLLSVPYALSVGSIPDLNSLKVNEAIYNPVDSALFEVKNKDGNTVFAVYNEGVHVFVDDNIDKSKGTKGGFSIGGFDALKGETYEFFRVTPDSVRIYVDEGATKGPKGGFAIGGFDRNKGMTEDFMHLSEDNYFIGYESGANITEGLYNSFFGYRAGVENSTGSNNVFIGHETGFFNTEGSWNVFLGNSAGFSNMSGHGNIILGDAAGLSNSSGSWNVFMGDMAGLDNTSGDNNVYIGSNAGYSNTIGSNNVFMGSNAGYGNTEGQFNVFMGEKSGYTNSTGISNVLLGNEAGNQNGTGSYNVFLGTLTGYENTTGLANVFLGQESGGSNTTGSYNIALGALAGYNSIVGDSSVYIGFKAGYYETESNRLYIDNDEDDGMNALIYGEFDNDILSFYAHTYVWGDLYAKDIYASGYYSGKSKGSQDLTNVLGNVITLQPVEYESEPSKGINYDLKAEKQIGLIADEVENLFPSLVKENVKGEKGINYSRLSVVLLQAIKEQQDIIDRQQERLNILENKVEQLISQSGN